MKKIIISMVVIAVVVLTAYFIYDWYANRLKRNPNFAYGNGRIEATEINIAARLPGKVERLRVLEGEMVEEGQVLVVMQTNVLVANLAQAEAKREQAKAQETSALANIELQTATLAKKKSELARNQALEANARSDYNRYKKLIEQDATSKRHFENAETEWFTAKANLDSAKSAIMEAEANLSVAKADRIAARANIMAAEAEMASIKADIDDSILRAPLKGRVQYRVAEPGEVLSAGGRAINMVDLTDVYITFFLPEQTAGKVKIGADVRIVLDAAPTLPLPAKVTYVADVAQFTPKTVETEVERQKLMFRIKAHIDREVLVSFMDLIKTGIPGVAWVKLNDSVPWPKELEVSAKTKARVQAAREAAARNADKTPASVIKSNTRDQAKKNLLDVNRIQKELKGATKEKGMDIAAQAARDVNAIRQKQVDENVAKARQADAAKQASVEQTVKEVKSADEAASQAPVKGIVK